MKSQVRSDIGSNRFGRHESLGPHPHRRLLSSQRLEGQATSQRRPFVPRKTFTFHGSRRKTNASIRTDTLSLVNSLCTDTSRRQKLTPRPAPETIAANGAAEQLAAPSDGNSVPLATAGGPAEFSRLQPEFAAMLQQRGSDLAAAIFAQPQATMVQHMVSGTLLMEDREPQMADQANETEGAVNAADGGRRASWIADRLFAARDTYLSGNRRRAKRQRRGKLGMTAAASRPYRKIFYSESEGKWIEHRIFEGEPQVTNSLSGTQPFPKTIRRRHTAEKDLPHKVKGRKTSKMREMLPTAFVKGGDKQDQPCRKIDVTDQLRMELYKRNMPVVPTSYQEHIYKFGKPPFRGNPRTH